ncbi:TPA: 23S rRNA methyltransferase attenuation leader peptide, partial [Streptococcus pneumoniae]|nr:23S rRNA methyltransferase attenuation leader peptide [Streptococcus pneumoniae]
TSTVLKQTKNSDYTDK